MKLVKIRDLFIVKNGNGLELINLEPCRKSTETVNFVSRIDKNSGISAFVKKIPGVEPFPGNTITVAVGGSVLSTFYQDGPFYTGFHVQILFPKRKYNREEMLFYAYCISMNKYRYNYGRQANKTLKNILIPEEMLESWREIRTDKFKKIHNFSLGKKSLDFVSTKWKKFELKSIFNFEKCKCSSATDMLEKGNDAYYIGAKKTHNGIMEKVKIDNSLMSHGNCIVFIGDGQGSVGLTNYQPLDFIGSTTLTCGYNKNLNKYTGMFLVTVLDRERYRYNYGRKYGKDQLIKAKIDLPSTFEGAPDWKYMEYYIKGLPYSAEI